MSDETRAGPPVDGFVQIVGKGPGFGRSGSAHAAPGLGLLVIETDAVFDQKFKGRRVLLGPNANELTVRVPAVIVGVVGMIQVELIGGILDPLFLLQAGSSPEAEIAAADHAVTAYGVVFLDHDD